MHLTSPAFSDGEPIPDRHAFTGVPGGTNLSLPLAWSDVPEGTASFALSIIDPHPVARNWVHWMVINIPSGEASLPEGASGHAMPRSSKELQNSFGTMGYGGPKPPRGSGVHPYVVTVYALSAGSLDLPANTPLETFLTAVSDKTLDSASLTGTFEQ